MVLTIDADDQEFRPESMRGFGDEGATRPRLTIRSIRIRNLQSGMLPASCRWSRMMIVGTVFSQPTSKCHGIVQQCLLSRFQISY